MEIENRKQKNREDYLKLASDCFAENLNVVKNIEKENQVDLISGAAEIMNNNLFMDDKPTFVEWFIDDECVSQDLKITEESKAFLHDLIEKTNFILSEIAENSSKKI